MYNIYCFIIIIYAENATFSNLAHSQIRKIKISILFRCFQGNSSFKKLELIFYKPEIGNLFSGRLISGIYNYIKIITIGTICKIIIHR